MLIDFTRPEGTLAHLAACKELGVKAVIGTTGFRRRAEGADRRIRQANAIVPRAQHERGRERGAEGPRRCRRARSTEGYDIEIIEAHHRHKVDAPSGTALKMGEVVAAAVGRDLKDCAVYAREGITGERDPSSIGFATVRGGDIVGDHTVLFAGTGERIEIRHRPPAAPTSRRAACAPRASSPRPATGLYGMDAVLGLN